MSNEKFVLVSLKEDKAKKLAQVISNESCRRILDYLSENEQATESELAEKLSLPISTVHYNLKHLVDGSLVTADEYHYSKKMKEIVHYKLANKYIIIAPKTTYGIKERLKRILPVVLLVGAASFVIQLIQKSALKIGAASSKIAPALMESMESSYKAAAPAMDALREQAAEKAVMASASNVTQALAGSSRVIEVIKEPNYALWFLFGALFTLIIYFAVEWIIRKRE